MATPYYPHEMGRWRDWTNLWWRSCVSWFLIIAGTGRTLCRKQFLLTTPVCMNRLDVPLTAWCSAGKHPRRPRGSQSGREKRRGENFQVRAKEPLGTDFHQAISINSSGFWLLIGHKKCFCIIVPNRRTVSPIASSLAVSAHFCYYFRLTFSSISLDEFRYEAN